MVYLYILIVCWVVAFFFVRARNAKKTAFAIQHLQSIGADVAHFRAHMAHPKFLLIELWASIFIGSLFGGAICLLYWVFTAVHS